MAERSSSATVRASDFSPAPTDQSSGDQRDADTRAAIDAGAKLVGPTRTSRKRPRPIAAARPSTRWAISSSTSSNAPRRRAAWWPKRSFAADAWSKCGCTQSRFARLRPFSLHKDGQRRWHELGLNLQLPCHQQPRRAAIRLRAPVPLFTPCIMRKYRI
jgi:hypothetical protein